MPASDQIHVREGDTRARTADAAQRILAEQHDTVSSGASRDAGNAADSAALVQSHTLPDLRIEGGDSPAAPHESGFMHFVHGAETVVSDLARGAGDEAVHHPLELVGSALSGLAIGTAAILAGPEIAGAAAIGGALYVGFQLLTNIGNWTHQVNVVTDEQNHTATEVAAAHQELQNVGGRGAVMGAGVIGSFGASPMGGIVRASLSRTGSAIDTTVVSVVPRLEGPTTPALERPQGVPMLAGRSRVPLLEGPARAPLLEGPTAESSQGAAASATGDSLLTITN